jgi:hypothetical protein
MSIRHGFFANAGGGAPQDNAPSSGDGSFVESRFDPSTGQRVPGAGPAPCSVIQSTAGGLGDSPTGLADAASFRRTRAQVSGISDDCDSNCSAAGMALPTGEGADFRTAGRIPADSNLQSTTTAPPEGPLVRSSGGGDAAGLYDSNMGAGGTSIA